MKFQIYDFVTDEFSFMKCPNIIISQKKSMASQKFASKTPSRVKGLKSHFFCMHGFIIQNSILIFMKIRWKSLELFYQISESSGTSLHPSKLSSVEDLSILDQEFAYEEKFRVDRRKLEQMINGEGDEIGKSIIKKFLKKELSLCHKL